MSVLELIERVRRIPDAARTYACDERFARLHFGLDEPALRELAGNGLPSVSEGGQLRFEYGDLHYIGLHMRSAATFTWAARQWASSLAQLAEHARTRVRIEYLPQLAADAGPTPGFVRLPDGDRRAVVLENGQPAAALEITLRGDWPALPPDAARVVSDFAAAVGFYPLPSSLQGDTQLVRRIGLSDCQTAAHAIVEDWRAAAFEARVAHGFFVTLPYTTLHSWPEVRVDELWVPVDPLMLGVMRDFGGLDAAHWPLDRSPGATLWDVEEHADARLMTASEPVETTFLTTIVTAWS